MTNKELIVRLVLGGPPAVLLVLVGSAMLWTGIMHPSLSWISRWMPLTLQRELCRWGCHLWVDNDSESGRVCVAYGGWAEKCAHCTATASGSNR